MNLPNKITITRIILSIIILILLCFPFEITGYEFPKYVVNGMVSVDLKFIIACGLFIIASLSDMIDGKLARKMNQVTEFGKVMDAIADKILVNGVLIILAYYGFISVFIPVVIITRDTFVDAFKTIIGNNKGAVGASVSGKIKTVFMMCGVSLMLLYNLPFELYGLRVADFLILVATALSIYSGVEYYIAAKPYLKGSSENK